MKKLWIGVLVLLLAGNVFGANWIEIEKGNENTISIDTNSILKREINGQNLIGGWAKVVFKNINTNIAPGKPTKEMKLLMWNNCQSRLTSGAMTAIFYDKNEQTLYTLKKDTSEMRLDDVIPGSNFEVIHDGICITSFLQEVKESGSPMQDATAVIKKYPYQYKQVKQVQQLPK